MEFTFDLLDGTPLFVRPIRPEDKALLIKGFEQLSPESRYRRFFHQIDHLSESQLKYLTEVDFVNHSALICVRADDMEQGVGVARWVRLSSDSDVAEAAITVVDRYQNKGVGKTLLYLLSRDAIEKGIRAFKAWVVGENAVMFRLLDELGSQGGQWQLGTMELTVPLPDTVEELEATAAPTILRAVAAGQLHASASTGTHHGTVLSSSPGAGEDHSTL